MSQQLPPRFTTRQEVQAVARDCDKTIKEVEEPFEPDEPEEPDESEVPCFDDDSNWDVFIGDDDELDPLPDPGDFWTAQD